MVRCGIGNTIRGMFSVGDKETDNDVPDGNVSSSVTFATLFGMISVFVTIYGSRPTIEDAPHITTWSIVYGLVAIGLICWTILCYLVAKKNEFYIDQKFEFKDPVARIKLIFLVGFGIGLLIDECLRIAIDMECLSPEHTAVYLSSIVLRFFRVSFILVQSGSILYLDKSKFQAALPVYYGLSLILLSNFTIWLNTSIRDVAGIYITPNITDITSTVFCYWNSSINANILQKLTRYFVPLQLEYSLLSICFILRLYPKSVVIEENEMSEYDMITDMDESENSHRSITRNNVIRFQSVLVFGLCLIINIPPLILSIICEYAGSSDTSHALEICKIVHAGLMIVFVLIGFAAYSQEPFLSYSVKDHSFSDDYVYIFSSTGSVAIATLGLISSIELQKSVTFTVMDVASVIQVFFQTIFTVYAKRVKVHRNDKQWTDCMFLLLSFGNLTVWLLNEFFGIGGTMDKSHEKLLGHYLWHSVAHVVGPLDCFYRFQSFLFMYSLHKEMKFSPM